MALLKKAIENKPDFKAIILLRRVNLLEQTQKRIKAFMPDIEVSVYSGSQRKKELHGQIIISTIQSVYRQSIPGLNCIIVDEVHNLDERDGQYIALINAHPAAKVIGFTATPFRTSGYIYGTDKLFKNVCYRKPLYEMIEEGFLVQPRLKKVDHQFNVAGLRVTAGEYNQKDIAKLTSDEKKIREQVENALSRMTDRKKIVWACASIEHAEKVEKELREKGESVECLHSEMEHDQRAKAQFNFENGISRHLTFVSVISEGYDYPPIDCIVLMRPIRSPSLYIQIVGRGLRTAKEKVDCLVLDYGKVVETLGPLDSPLVSEARKSKSVTEIKMKFCPKCFEYIALSAKTCPVCEYQIPNMGGDRTGNLSRTASENGQLLRGRPVEQVLEIEKVEFSKYTSKNGNQCLVIQYQTNDFARRYLKEYYVFNNEWAYKKLLKRLIEFNCDVKATIDEQVKCFVRNTPKSINYVLDEKYPKITKVNFT